MDVGGTVAPTLRWGRKAWFCAALLEAEVLVRLSLRQVLQHVVSDFSSRAIARAMPQSFEKLRRMLTVRMRPLIDHLGMLHQLYANRNTGS